MTDKEIVKALECCVNDDYDFCIECPAHRFKGCNHTLIKYANDIVNRQQEEIASLKIEIDRRCERIIADLKKTDMVEVVRCKDCLNLGMSVCAITLETRLNGYIQIPERTYKCEHFGTNTILDGYCYFGRKRTGNENL